MAYSIKCADAGTSCPAAFITEDRDELLEHAVNHQKAAHPDVEVTDQTSAYLGSLIKTV